MTIAERLAGYQTRPGDEKPFPAVAEIEGHLAFYPDRVDKIEET